MSAKSKPVIDKNLEEKVKNLITTNSTSTDGKPKAKPPIDPILEKKVKTLITTKMQNPDFQKGLTAEESVMVDKLLEIFPDLKDLMPDSQFTINKNETVLDEIKINDVVYYQDRLGGIWNSNAELVGSVNKKNNKELYHFFDKKYDLKVEPQS